MSKLTVVERNALLTASKVGPRDFNAIAELNGLSRKRAREVITQALEKLGASVDDYGDWRPLKSSPVSVVEMERRLGRSRSWVKARLTAFEHLSLLSDLSGRSALAYEPVVLRRLLQVRDNQPDPSWVSVNAASNRLGCGWYWVASRIGRYRNLMATRLFYGREVRVYPPEILWSLSLELKATRRRAGVWLTLPELSRRTGRSRAWIKRQLDWFGIKPERRPMYNKRLVPHYPPEAEFLLRRVDRALKRAGDWLSLRQVADQAGVAYDTAKQRLDRLDVRPKPRLTLGTNQLADHWPPTVVAMVAQCPHDTQSCRCSRS